MGGGPPYSPHVSQREKLFCKTPFFRQRLRNLSAENTKQTVFSEVNEMKKNFTPKLFGLALTTALTLTTLTACGGGTGTAAAPGGVSSTPAAVQETANGSVGTVLLSVNPEIEMDYDDAGNVVALNGLNDDGKAVLASYTGYEGKACTTVIGELVDEINAGGYFDATIDGHEKNIVLKLERGSKYPSDQFLNELAEAVRLVVEADQIGSQTVALDDDDYDDAYADKGYINAQAAQNILSTQLGRDDIQFVEKDYDLDDGEYEVEFVMDGVEYEYEVNAVTGKVTEMDADYQDYDDTDYGPNADGVTDYDDTDYGPNADGVTDYDDTDYGPNADGVTDYDDTDYGPNADGVTDYDDTDYGPNADGITDYDDTDYGPNADGITDYDDTDYGPNADGVTDYDDTDYGPNADGVTDYDDDDWYGDPTGSDYPGDSDDWDDDDDDDDDWDGEDHWDDDDDGDDDWDD